MQVLRWIASNPERRGGSRTALTRTIYTLYASEFTLSAGSLPRVYPREPPLDSQHGNVSSLAFLQGAGGLISAVSRLAFQGFY